jgi:hypothetical protein
MRADKKFAEKFAKIFFRPDGFARSRREDDMVDLSEYGIGLI